MREKAVSVHLIACAALLLQGCGGATETPSVNVEEVTFTTEDELELSGTLYLSEGADTAVVLPTRGRPGPTSVPGSPLPNGSP